MNIFLLGIFIFWGIGCGRQGNDIEITQHDPQHLSMMLHRVSKEPCGLEVNVKKRPLERSYLTAKLIEAAQDKSEYLSVDDHRIELDFTAGGIRQPYIDEIVEFSGLSFSDLQIEEGENLIAKSKEIEIYLTNTLEVYKVSSAVHE